MECHTENPNTYLKRRNLYNFCDTKQDIMVFFIKKHWHRLKTIQILVISWNLFAAQVSLFNQGCQLVDYVGQDCFLMMFINSNCLFWSPSVSRMLLETFETINTWLIFNQMTMMPAMMLAIKNCFNGKASAGIHVGPFSSRLNLGTAFSLHITWD